MERRRENRVSVGLPGTCSINGCEHQIYFFDISANGCRMRCMDFAAQPDDIMDISLGPIGPLNSTVRWVTDDCMGVEFDTPLEAEIVSYFSTFLHMAA